MAAQPVTQLDSCSSPPVQAQGPATPIPDA